MKPFLCSLLLFFAFSLNAQAPIAVPVSKEPHHHLVLENSYVRAFRVSIPAHDTTLLHQHDLPYIYVSLGPADVVNAVAGKPEAHLVMTDGQVGYSRGGFAHIARTDAGIPFNNVTIELLRPQGESRNLCTQIIPGAVVVPCGITAADNEKSFFVEPQFETAELTADLLRMRPDAAKFRNLHQQGFLLVVLSESQIQIESQGKPVRTLSGGEVVWLEADSHEKLSNPGKKTASYLQLSFKDIAKP